MTPQIITAGEGVPRSTSTGTGTAQQQQHTTCAKVPQLTIWRPAGWRWKHRPAVHACSITTGKTYLRLRRLLRFQARLRLFLTVVHKPHLRLRVLRLSQQGPSTFQPPRLLLRSAQQYQYPQMCQPRRLMLRPSHSLPPALSLAAKTCNRCNYTRYRYYHPPNCLYAWNKRDSFVTTAITPLQHTTRGGE